MVFPAHAAIKTVFAAKIGDFDNSAQKNAAAKLAASGFDGPGVKPFLLSTAGRYKFGTLRHPIYNHGGSKRTLWRFGKRNLLRDCALRLHARVEGSKAKRAGPCPIAIKPLNC